jgi:hypothetical protein
VHSVGQGGALGDARGCFGHIPQQKAPQTLFSDLDCTRGSLVGASCMNWSLAQAQPMNSELALSCRAYHTGPDPTDSKICSSSISCAMHDH